MAAGGTRLRFDRLRLAAVTGGGGPPTQSIAGFGTLTGRAARDPELQARSRPAARAGERPR